jgi:hypothetical protein
MGGGEIVDFSGGPEFVNEGRSVAKRRSKQSERGLYIYIVTKFQNQKIFSKNKKQEVYAKFQKPNFKNQFQPSYLAIITRPMNHHLQR